jgi:hypothetical protein
LAKCSTTLPSSKENVTLNIRHSPFSYGHICKNWLLLTTWAITKTDIFYILSVRKRD